jgi:hypothetical protein
MGEGTPSPPTPREPPPPVAPTGKALSSLDSMQARGLAIAPASHGGNVNLARKTLSFMPAKTERKRKRLEVPIHPRLMSWLKMRTPGTDAESLFPALYCRQSRRTARAFLAVHRHHGGRRDRPPHRARGERREAREHSTPAASTRCDIPSHRPWPMPTCPKKSAAASPATIPPPCIPVTPTTNARRWPAPWRKCRVSDFSKNVWF